MNENKTFFATPYLKGVGQIMLQDSAWTGLFFLAGIFFDSYILGLAAVLAVVVGTLTAKVLKYPEENINMGLYGFSATLVGVGMVTFFEPALIVWIAIVVGSVVATILQHLFISRKVPGFTFPFILVTWILYYVFTHVYKVNAPVASIVPADHDLDDLVLSSRGFGEVIFQASIVAGVLFIIGVFLSSPIAALYGLAGSVISAVVAFYLAEPIAGISQGMFSFNAVLCAITFAGVKQKDGIFVLISVLLAIAIEVFMIKLSFTPYLTFPFVAACWITIPIKKLIPQSTN
ncbi:urea transporter [Taibaiella soli]|uniref:Urea transporter n=1 Tax=Taibaiella soli TaxID=1649169 RepID=A0A2W2B7M9_9BACT|nr:urea transporter [Taibaiella soli]PZF72269.1 urea transporter [Taibaiella soli]